jgi:uncharacterized protein (DUF433 family)
MYATASDPVSSYQCLDFGELEYAVKWYTKGRESGIAVDPGRNHGQPIVEKVNIPTDVLVSLHSASNSMV